MRILLVSDHDYLPDRVGGRESSIDELANRLARRGHETKVLARTKSRNTRRPTGSVYWPVDYSLERASDVTAVAERHLAAGRFDVALYSVTGFASLLSSQPAIRRRQVLYVRDANEIDLWTPQTFPAAQTLFANSAFIAGRIEERTGLRPHVVPPVIDFAKYRVDTRGTAVSFINPVHQKGVEFAFTLAEKHPEIPFRFALCWDLYARAIAQLRRRTEQLSNLTLVDASLDVRGLYSDTRILLVPSQWDEGFGRVVLEAQCSGIPVIASNRGGLPEAVGDGGWLIPAETDTAAWSRALNQLWTDQTLWDEVSACARKRAVAFEQETEINIQRLEGKLSPLARPAIVVSRPVAKCSAILLPSEGSSAATIRSLASQNCEHLEILALEQPGQDILAGTDMADTVKDIRQFDPEAGLAPQVFSLLREVECGFVLLARSTDRFDPDFIYTLQSTHLNSLWTAAAAVCDVGVLNSRGNIVIPSTSGFRAKAKADNNLAMLENNRDTFGFSASSLPWEVPRFSPLPVGTMFRRDALMLLESAPATGSPSEFLRFLRFGAHIIGGTLYTDRVLCWSDAPADALKGAMPHPGPGDLTEELSEAAVAAMIANDAGRHLKPETISRMLFGHFSRKRILALCDRQPALRDILIKSFIDGPLCRPD
ncbi:glycosyltransferase [Sinorhizobium fredii]|uniref:glycosyltransferase n=1 Tax=Rhizobium fredii TaxID=380 RepID=UPI0004B11CA9|nr:glycosyltransferase [Sinorhizobium fredii]